MGARFDCVVPIFVYQNAVLTLRGRLAWAHDWVSDPSLDADYLFDALKRKKIAIKPALMDQSVVAGLGNIYAAEALWEAEMNPRKPASTAMSRRSVAAGGVSPRLKSLMK